MQLDWPPIEQLPEFRTLLHEALLRGWTLDLLAAAFVAHAHATGSLPTCEELRKEICAGTFDTLFFSRGQSLS
jgi:hypothetical protein